MALKWSCLIHGLLLLLLPGCLAHRTAAAAAVPALLAAPDAEIADAKQFAQAVGEKMPLWDADTIACYERAQIANVKADVLASLQENDRGALLEDVARLHDDWNALLALDEMLKQQSLI